MRAELRRPTLLCLASVLVLSCTLGPPARWPEPAALRVIDGFAVEKIYHVPRDEQGSWVSLAVTADGRLIASDQEGALYRITPAPLGSPSTMTRVERVESDLGSAHGLTSAFGGLYVTVNRGMGIRVSAANGLHRMDDAAGVLGPARQLRHLDGAGEHGPHTVVPTPDGRALYFLAGNDTRPTRFSSSRRPRLWREDQLLPVIPNRWILNLPPPGGWIARIDPEGRDWELVANGFRNPYDMAVGPAGDLFVFDADMEWDIGTAWYRPTRLLHVVSGGEYGWRKGSAKWPVTHADSLPAVVDIGTGSPTGITFGTGARFPERYQRALYLLDWSHGKIYAVHLEPDGASYRARVEPFLAGQPLPVTDVVVRPRDGAMYLTTGGRGTASGIYRVTYVGDEPSDPLARPMPAPPNEQHALRRELEKHHVPGSPGGLEAAWAQLDHPDRFVRFAARVALENQELASWQERARLEGDPARHVAASIARARLGAASDRDAAVEALLALDLPASDGALERRVRLDWLRAMSLWFSRHGAPGSPAPRDAVVARLDAMMPAASFDENRALSELSVFLGVPSAAAKIVALLESAPTQEEQTHYAAALRALEVGWTPALRLRYFAWFDRAADLHGGASFQYFVDRIESDARDTLTAAERRALANLRRREPPPVPERPLAKGPGRAWRTEDLAVLLGHGLRGRDAERGRDMFTAGTCFTCHRFAARGGAVGPDLTQVGTRFSPIELAESILEPERTVSDQYQMTRVYRTDGSVVTGRVVNLLPSILPLLPSGVELSTSMVSGETVLIPPDEVLRIEPLEASMMPPGLVDGMNEDELLDLLAYLVAGGDPDHAVFR